MNMRRAVVSFFGTRTGFATQVASLISRIKPAFSSRCTSSLMALRFGFENRHRVCFTGLALGLTLSACSASSLGIPGMSDGCHAKISQRSRRNSMSALSYASVRSFNTLTFFVRSVRWTCVWEVCALASNSLDAFFLPSSTSFAWSTPAVSALCSSVRDNWLNLEEMQLNSLS